MAWRSSCGQGAPGRGTPRRLIQRGLPRLTLGEKALLTTATTLQQTGCNAGGQPYRGTYPILSHGSAVTLWGMYQHRRPRDPAVQLHPLDMPSGPTPHTANLCYLKFNPQPTPAATSVVVSGSINLVPSSSIPQSTPPRPGAICVTRSCYAEHHLDWIHCSNLYLPPPRPDRLNTTHSLTRQRLSCSLTRLLPPNELPLRQL
ncbi:hypothetical protein IWX90DRAFT_236937 [Phyllosticta citrichinensis]|uniref:Uncharacterized protein n=1 Tax=Phyllosticta citrichinensis TaxID=1130410 RepID=A0ABR1XQ45_9PEZI